MKANEFVKKFGWKNANQFLELTSYSIDELLILQSGLNVQELKRLVESHELVGVKGGLNTAKFLVQGADKLTYQLEQKGFSMNGVPNKAIDELRQAIADVESCQ